jgi:hypothetical protein
MMTSGMVPSEVRRERGFLKDGARRPAWEQAAVRPPGMRKGAGVGAGLMRTLACSHASVFGAASTLQARTRAGELQPALTRLTCTNSE